MIIDWRAHRYRGGRAWSATKALVRSWVGLTTVAEAGERHPLPKMPYERRERPVPFSHRPRKPWKW